MIKMNPYRPGAGLMPVYLAGRDAELQNAQNLFDALTMGIPASSVIYNGLRGVGKTVLLNKMEEIADEKNVLYEHIEIDTKSDFIVQITAACQSFLRKLSVKQRAKDFVARALETIKTLVVSFDPENQTFSLSLQEQELYKSSSLTKSLTDVFVALGKAAQSSDSAICFFIDEIQFMKKEELSALICALHRVNQLSYPMIMIGAGLPKVYKLLGDVKSYSERLFEYHVIGSLEKDQAEEAIREPASRLSVTYVDDAVEEIVRITKGYPYFIQQLCSILWDNRQENVIRKEDVDRCHEIFLEYLDTGFFRVRYERCTQNEKQFLLAMVQCGKLPCTISNVAKNLHKDVKSISPVRAQLINKGIIYAIRHSELDFTVPEFDGFLGRLQGKY